MKCLTISLIGLLLLAILSSCPKEEEVPYNEELFNKVFGRWELVSFTLRGGCYRGVCNIHFNISDSLLLPNDYVVALNFKDDGAFVKEYHSGDTEQHSWLIHQNSLVIHYSWYALSNETEIYKLTNAEFHFKIIDYYDENFFVIYELKR